MKKFFFAATILLSVAVTGILSQDSKIHFMHLNRESGFTGKTVNSILQDSRNFIWIATDGGLNRFDGYEFKVFKPDPKIPESISSYNVTTLYEDQDDNLWIGTEFGLNVFERGHEKFKKYFSVDSLENTLSFNYIRSIVEDKSGKIIIGTGGGVGLCLYNKDSDDFTRLKIKNRTEVDFGKEINFLGSLPDGNIITITKGRNLHIIETQGWEVVYSHAMPGNIRSLMVYGENVYLGFEENFMIFNIYDKSFKSKSLKHGVDVSRGFISTFEVDNQGVVWIGTTNNGLYLYKPNIDEVIDNFTHDEFNPSSISGQGISQLFIDKTGKLWIGTWNAGINYYHSDIIKFKNFKNSALGTNNLPGNKVNTLCQDSDSNLWVGTEQGLAVYRMSNGQIVQKDFLGSMFQRKTPVLSIFEDHEGQIWIGTFLGGLSRYNPNNKDIEVVLDSASYSVQDIVEPSPGILWLGTMESGIVEYNTRTGFVREKIFPEISVDYFTKFLKDDHDNIWMGTAYGLFRYDIKKKIITKYLNDPSDPFSISNNHIYGLLNGTDKVYVATSSGLNIYSYSKDQFYKIGCEQGLSDEFISSLEVDSVGRIWVSTIKSISSIIIDPQSNDVVSIVNYSSVDGVQDAEFRGNSSVHLKSGELLFGGNKGINYFMPEFIRSSSYLQQAIITNLLLYNNEIKPHQEYNGRVILDEAITETNAVIFKYSENSFSIEFSALNSIVPEKCQYKYILEGFDQDWIVVGATQRRANYTNLDAGEYIFKVKASNSDGVWSDYSDSLTIKILPPIWKTKWALIIYAFAILFLLLGLRQLVILNERQQSKEKLAIQEAKRQHEIDNLKIRFFTNISHEFRTPLTLIITPLEKILKDARYKELEPALQTIHRNSRRLLNLVNQLLDFRKMEVSGMKLQVSSGDIVKFLKEMVSSFSDLAEKKFIAYKFRSNVNELVMQFDHDKMEKIIFNLLSNAFKYTLEKGEITVEVDLIDQFSMVSGSEKNVNNREIQVKVKDNGIGIPANKLESIFDRFIQAENSKKVIEHGSGIGLSLTYEFVKLHNGNITVESEEGKGSCFTFTIPIGIKNVELLEKDETLAINFNNEFSGGEQENKTAHDSAKSTLVLVEDSEDLRFYLRDNLQLEYNIFEAPNGKIGFQKIKEVLPDVIITDIMMPEVNGIELCQLVKNNPTTSHIPIVMLTARTSEEQKVAGYGSGADAFLTKPFSFEVLEMRIKNLIDQRNKLKQIFHKKIDVNPSEISVTSIDEKLIKKALEIVEQNMSNTDFTVEQLGRDLGMSRVHLYKKLLSLTGKSPIEFIRILRLKRAAQLLQKSQMRISEIAYEVGFNNPKYFSKYFKEQFKMLPTEYAQKYSKPSENHSID